MFRVIVLQRAILVSENIYPSHNRQRRKSRASAKRDSKSVAQFERKWHDGKAYGSENSTYATYVDNLPHLVKRARAPSVYPRRICHIKNALASGYVQDGLSLSDRRDTNFVRVARARARHKTSD